MNTSEMVELSAVVIPLLKGVIYKDDNPKLWTALANQISAVRDYVSVLGLAVLLDESEGYAYVRSQNRDVAEEETLPRLVARRPLSYSVSLMLALLRKKLTEFDAQGASVGPRLVLTRDAVVEMMRVFLPSGSNEVKEIDKVDKTLKQISDLGFIRQLRGRSNEYEVRRIIKAVVDAQWLAEFEQKILQMSNPADDESVEGESDE